jgi:cell division protein FtsL
MMMMMMVVVVMMMMTMTSLALQVKGYTKGHRVQHKHSRIDRKNNDLLYNGGRTIEFLRQRFHPTPK